MADKKKGKISSDEKLDRLVIVVLLFFAIGVFGFLILSERIDYQQAYLRQIEHADLKQQLIDEGAHLECLGYRTERILYLPLTPESMNDFCLESMGCVSHGKSHNGFGDYYSIECFGGFDIDEFNKCIEYSSYTQEVCVKEVMVWSE